MNTTLYTSPKLDGFRMPAEHEPQEQVWMAWPTREDNWREQGKYAQQEFIGVANAIAPVCSSDLHRRQSAF